MGERVGAFIGIDESVTLGAGLRAAADGAAGGAAGPGARAVASVGIGARAVSNGAKSSAMRGAAEAAMRRGATAAMGRGRGGAGVEGTTFKAAVVDVGAGAKPACTIAISTPSFFLASWNFFCSVVLAPCSSSAT